MNVRVQYTYIYTNPLYYCSYNTISFASQGLPSSRKRLNVCIKQTQTLEQIGKISHMKRCRFPSWLPWETCSGGVATNQRHYTAFDIQPGRGYISRGPPGGDVNYGATAPSEEQNEEAETAMGKREGLKLRGATFRLSRGNPCLWYGKLSSGLWWEEGDANKV